MISAAKGKRTSSTDACLGRCGGAYISFWELHYSCSWSNYLYIFSSRCLHGLMIVLNKFEQKIGYCMLYDSEAPLGCRLNTLLATR